MKREEDAVVAEPMRELAIASAKYAGDCMELHLAQRRLSSLGQDFPLFMSLDTLWLNNNRLQSIEGLEENFRLKRLYLHCNRIEALEEGSLAPFGFLETLTVRM
jgi:Leucine-rich repeat (LRR) protein